MAYSAITNGEIDQDSPVTQQLMTKVRDNPLELLSGSTGYMNAGNWVPVDWTFGSQAGTGIIYDHAVDGSVSNIDYTLEDGWEYMFLIDVNFNISTDSELKVDVSQNGGSSFSEAVQSDPYAFNDDIVAALMVLMPRVDSYPKYIDFYPSRGGRGDAIVLGDAIDQIRIRIQSRTITSGTVRAFRRREYITAS